MTPINDATVRGDETVVATLAASAALHRGPAASATVTIQSDDDPADGDDRRHGCDRDRGRPTTGQYTVTRTGATTAALTVGYTVSGTATAGSDYPALSGSVTIPAGATRRR